VAFAYDYALENRETFQRNLSAATTLEVDNVNGFVHVTGDSGNTVRVDGEKIIRAQVAEAMERAKSEVTLDITDSNGVARLYVNGPFRNGGHEHRNYQVIYNLTIRVPQSIALRLKSVNGEIRAAGTSGQFDLSAVNGAIDATDISGSGSVGTVNGKQTISFRANPQAATRFHTVNGSIDLTFQPNLAADVRVSTLNGSVYSAFEESSPPAQTEWHPRRRSAQFKIGGGGPELSFETLNGSIRIGKAK
jgi:hypothetical protein